MKNKDSKPYADRLTLELTRKCNMNCIHCMRGDAQNISMSDDIIRAAFSKVRHVNSLLLTGGEVSMVPDRIRAVSRIARELGVKIGRFHIVTNGKSIGPRFIESVRELYNYCDTPEECCIAYSNDQFHDELSPRQYAALERLARVGTENIESYVKFLTLKHPKRTGNYSPYNSDVSSRYVDHRDGQDLIAMGRGNENFSARATLMHEFGIYKEYNDIDIEGDLYVAANGRLLPGCDLSYAAMDYCDDLFMGNILDPKLDLVNACEKFNAHLVKRFGTDIVAIHEYDLDLNDDGR